MIDTTRTRVLGLVAGVAVVLAAGCGSNSTARLTRDALIKQGNAICKHADGQIDAAGETAFSSPGNPPEAEIVAFAKSTILPAIQDELDQLGKLSPPEADEAQVARIIDTAQRTLDAAKANPALLANDDSFDEASRLADAYGLTDCSS